MKVTRTGPATLTAEFENEEELGREQASNLSIGALLLPTSEVIPLNTLLEVTLRGPGGGEVVVRATVVANLGNAVALSLDRFAEGSLAPLLSKPVPAVEDQPAPEAGEGSDAGEAGDGKRLNAWDRVRSLSQMEKILLAIKAERSDRALLLQDNDPRVLLSLLRNPRLTVDEVSRLARSSFLTYQIADVIAKAAQWMANLDVRLGLIQNPKTPSAFALRILPTLPESEVRAIARAGTNMALKQAALRRLQGRG